MKKIDIDPDELFQLHYKVTFKKYDYLKRLARATPRGSLQRIIDSRLYGRGWRTEHDELRAAQRKMGLKDETFYHPAILKRMGVPVKPGRNVRPYGRKKKTKTGA